MRTGGYQFSKMSENCPTLVRTTNNKSRHNSTMKRIIVRKKTRNTRPPRGNIQAIGKRS